jgi:hypothetical protein
MDGNAVYRPQGPTVFYAGLEHLSATETYATKWIAFGYASSAPRHASRSTILIVTVAAELCLCGVVHFGDAAVRQLDSDTVIATVRPIMAPAATPPTSSGPR